MQAGQLDADTGHCCQSLEKNQVRGFRVRECGFSHDYSISPHAGHCNARFSSWTQKYLWCIDGCLSSGLSTLLRFLWKQADFTNLVSHPFQVESFFISYFCKQDNQMQILVIVVKVLENENQVRGFRFRVKDDWKSFHLNVERRSHSHCQSLEESLGIMGEYIVEDTEVPLNDFFCTKLEVPNSNITRIHRPIFACCVVGI